MANKHNGELEIELGGKKRSLRFSLNALAYLEEDCGKPLGEIFNDLDAMDMRTVRLMLYHGLRWENIDLKLTEVGSWEMNLSEVIGHLAEAISRAMGASTGKKTKRGQ